MVVTTGNRNGLLLKVAIMLLVGASVGVATVTVTEALEEVNLHAWERHGKAALEAKQYVDSLENAEHCRWRCPDGRDRYVCGMGGHEWAIVVYEGSRLVTAFISDDQAYVQSVIEPCDNHWRYAH